MQYCLNKKELDALIDNDWNISDDDPEFKELFLALSQSKLWETEIILFSYFLSQTLERKSKIGADCASIIKQTLEVQSTMWLSMQQFDIGFIKYMFRYLRDRNLTLEEEIINLQLKLGQFLYE